jgi:hypothetical protein
MRLWRDVCATIVANWNGWLHRVSEILSVSRVNGIQALRRDEYGGETKPNLNMGGMNCTARGSRRTSGEWLCSIMSNAICIRKALCSKS